MAKLLKKTWVRVALFVSLGVVVLGAILLVRVLNSSTVDTRSQAAYDPMQACFSMCDSFPHAVRSFCKSRCPRLAEGKMNCDQFCSVNGISYDQKNFCVKVCNERTKGHEAHTQASHGPAAIQTYVPNNVQTTPQTDQPTPVSTSTPIPVDAPMIPATVSPTTQPQSQPSSARTYTEKIFTSYKSSTASYGSSSGQVLTAYTPTGDTQTNRAAVILVHGGSFTSGSRASLASTAQQLTNYGYVAFSIDYRLCPTSIAMVWTNTPSQVQEGCIQLARQDTESAISWVRNNAAQYGVDPNKIILLGSSAGAIDSLYVGLEPLSGIQPPIAVVSDSGAILQPDLPAIGSVTPEPAVLFLHGSTDTVVPTGAALATYNTLQSQGIPAQWNLYQGAGHVIKITPTVLSSIVQFLAKYVN